eukprot:gene1758-1870_t
MSSKSAKIFGVDAKAMVTKITSILPPILPPPKKTRAMVLFEAGLTWMRRNRFSDASEKFRECLHELKYGKQGTVLTSEQMDELVIPALCNLAACNLELRQFNKAGSFCQEVLQLRAGHKGASYLLSVIDEEMAKSRAAMRYARPSIMYRQ